MAKKLRQVIANPKVKDVPIQNHAETTSDVCEHVIFEEEEEPKFKKTIKAYKLFRKKGDQIYPLFVNANKPVPMGKWLKAESGPVANEKGQVKSKLGPLAYRPGWHSGDVPVATHIGGKSKPGLKKPNFRPEHHVWAEVEHPADHDWQSVANSRGKGAKAHITDQVPYNGHYRYKTNPNMTGNWIISGNMKVNRLLHDDEVKDINKKAGVADLPRRHELKEDEQTDITPGQKQPKDFASFIQSNKHKVALHSKRSKDRTFTDFLRKIRNPMNEAILSGVKSPDRYTVHKDTNYEDTDRYSIKHKGKEVGFLTRNREKNNVNFVKIDPAHRGKGLASAIYKHIEKDIGGKMNPASEYTDAGRAFSQKYYGTDRAASYKKVGDKYVNENTITEEITPKVYHDIRPATLISLAKSHGTTRFIIDKHDRIHAGNAKYFIHKDLRPIEDGPSYDNSASMSNRKCGGSITFNRKLNKCYYDHEEDDDANHHHLQTLRGKGVERGKRFGDWSLLKVNPSPKKKINEDFDWTRGGGTKRAKVGKADIQYSVGHDGSSELSLITVAPKDRGKGHAHNAMKQFMQAADKNKSTMYLDAVQMGTKGAPKASLEKFYKSFGFKKNTDKSRDKEFVRHPNLTTFKEVFDQPYPVNIRHTNSSTVADFDSGRGKYSVDIYHLKNTSKGDTSDFCFSRDGDMSNSMTKSSFGETGSEGKHAARVFSTVQHVLKQHVDKFKPQTLTFDGSDVKKKLYDHLAKRSGYKTTTNYIGHKGSGQIEYTMHLESFKDVFNEVDYSAQIEADKKRKDEEFDTIDTLKNHYNYTPEEGKSLHDYTCGTGSKVNGIVDDIARKHQTPKEMTVWRKSKFDANKLKGPDGTFKVPVPISTTIHKSTATSYFKDHNVAHEDGITHHHIDKIKVPQGNHGAFIPDKHSINPRYKEFVLPSNTKFRHISSTHEQNGNSVTHTHELEVVR